MPAWSVRPGSQARRRIARRQALLLGVGSILLPRMTRAQAPAPARIGWLTISPHPHIAAFRLGMRDAGRTEGRDFVIVERYGDGGSSQRLDAFARELEAGADIVIASGGAGVLAARRVIAHVPVVAISSDLHGLGVVASYAQPGGNITGFDLAFDQVAAKWPELLVEVCPATRRIAVFVSDEPTTATPSARQFAAAAATAQRLGVAAFAVVAVDLAFARHIAAAAARGADGAVVTSNPAFSAARAGFIAAAGERRLPAVYENRIFPEDGGLMSYGPNLGDIFRRAALTADRILRGAAPASIPVELPTQFELVINRRAAHALDLAIPPAILARADAVIE